MRFGLKASVKGTIRLPNSFGIERDGVLMQFDADGNGRLDSITVSTKVDGESFAAILGPGVGEAKASINITSDPEISSRLWRYLQALESHIAFSSGGALEEIGWATPEEIRIPETDEEKAYASIPSFQVSYPPQRPVVILPPDVAAELVAAAFRGGRQLGSAQGFLA